MKPETIVIKPTFKCVGNCVGCSSRQELYKELKSERVLGLKEYGTLFNELKEMGLKKLVISGGEPTLYENIGELVELAKSFGFVVCLNTTGYNLTEDILDFNKLDAINFSLNGFCEEIDSKIRNKILFEKTVEGIKLARKFQHLDVNVNTIVNKYNYDSIDRLIELVKGLGVDMLHLSYVEGDWENKKLLLSKEQIGEFNSKIKKKIGLRQMDSFLSKMEDAEGIYNPKEICRRKENFAIVLPNGDVHPCNIVEYTHEPIVGNLFNEGFEEVWNGDKFRQFRENNYKYCKYCPVNIRCNILLRGESS